jgi:hypothetical protein
MQVSGHAVIANLGITIPTDVRARSVVRTISEKKLPAGGPARTEHLGYGTYSGYENEPIDAVAGIWDHKTRANFLPGHLSVVGSHEFSGNKGSVDTEGTVRFQGTIVGTQRAFAQDTYPFVLAIFDPVHFIWTEARIYTDRECGLTGHGASAHRASWEAVMGGPVFAFSEIARSSTSDLESQPECTGSTPPPANPTTGAGGSGGGGESVCYIWITYDLDSGEILHQQLLYCTDGGG